MAVFGGTDKRGKSIAEPVKGKLLKARLANVSRIQPPLVITDDQLDEVVTIIEKSLGEL